MTLPSSRLLAVSADDASAPYRSISDAALHASEGDQIIVAPGTYSPQRTNERFPIYIRPRCQLLGAGAEVCCLDGEGAALQILVRPLDPSQSLVLLGDETVLSGFTIQNSAANAVSNEHGARILVLDNVLQRSAQHGLLVFGAASAVVQDNRLLNNGLHRQAYTPPRAVAGRQGHHIYIEPRAGVANDVVISGNTMAYAYADGVAVAVFDQPSGVKVRVQVIDNSISGCERTGLTIGSSFGPSDSYVFIDVRNNRIFDNGSYAIDAEAAFSLINRVVAGAALSINIARNQISGGDSGINLAAGYSPSRGARLDCSVLSNRISNVKRYGMRLIGAVGMDGWPAEGSRVQTVIADNVLDRPTIGGVPLFVQGGVAVSGETVSGNTVFAHVVGNSVGEASAIVVNDGLAGNSVCIVDGSQPHRRVDGVIPYDSP